MPSTLNHALSRKLSIVEKVIFFVQPKTWIGIIQALKEQIPNSAHLISDILKTFFMNIVASFLILQITFSQLPPSNLLGSSTSTRSIYPFIIQPSQSHLFKHHHLRYNTSPSFITSQYTPVKNVAAITLLSPYTIAIFHEQIMPQINIFMNRMRMWKKLRVQPDNDAIRCLEDSIATNEAIRNNLFDVYFPPPSLSLSSSNENMNDKHEKAQKGLLLLPGAFIDHTSYSTIASKIAKKGLIVAVLSMEPLRLALRGLGADTSDLKRAMQIIEREWIIRSNDRSANTKFNSTINSGIEWSIGGHSAGAYGAMRLSSSLKKLLVNKWKRQTKLKIVIWAAGNIERYVPDLSKYKEDMEALVILGSNDPYCNFLSNNSNTALLSIFISRLPPMSKCKMVEGGTHNNFASYSGPVEFNGVPGISKEKQHELIADATAKFIFSDDE
jgi:hypothetical protein